MTTIAELTAYFDDQICLPLSIWCWLQTWNENKLWRHLWLLLYWISEIFELHMNIQLYLIGVNSKCHNREQITYRSTNKSSRFSQARYKILSKLSTLIRDNIIPLIQNGFNQSHLRWCIKMALLNNNLKICKIIPGKDQSRTQVISLPAWTQVTRVDVVMPAKANVNDYFCKKLGAIKKWEKQIISFRLQIIC